MVCGGWGLKRGRARAGRELRGLVHPHKRQEMLTLGGCGNAVVCTGGVRSRLSAHHKGVWDRGT